MSCGNTGGPVWFDDVDCNATLPGALTEKCNISSKVWGVHECTQRSDWACKCCASANSCNEQCVIGEWKIFTPRIQVENLRCTCIRLLVDPCLTTNLSCGGNGHCRSNDNDETYCYCNDGYSGETCQTGIHNIPMLQS